MQFTPPQRFDSCGGSRIQKRGGGEGIANDIFDRLVVNDFENTNGVLKVVTSSLGCRRRCRCARCANIGEHRQQAHRTLVPLRTGGGLAGFTHRPAHLEGVIAGAAAELVERHRLTL